MDRGARGSDAEIIQRLLKKQIGTVAQLLENSAMLAMLTVIEFS